MTIQEFKDKVKSYVREDVLADDSTWGSLEQDLETVVNTNLSGVIQNKEKILKEKKALELEYKTLKDTAGPLIDQGITLEQFSQLKHQLEEMQTKGAGTSDDLKVLQEKFYKQGKQAMEQELNPRLKEFETKVTTLEKEKLETSNKYLRYKKENQIMEAVKKLNIQADKYWLAGFSSEAETEYIETEDRLSLMVPNPVDPSGSKIPLQDWMKLFPTTSEGKKMIVVPETYGGGAVGSDGRPVTNANLRDTIDSLFR